MTSRRGFLLGVTSLLAAPAIVRATSIMPVKAARDVLTLPAGWRLGDTVSVYCSEFIAAYEGQMHLLRPKSKVEITARDGFFFEIERK